MANGFHLDRVKGSHHIYVRVINSEQYTVPVPKKKDLPVGTLKSILRQSGLPQDLFEER
jgi:predicted RNA binding protein YcfA (HicA-like mRNA interferase family)